MFLNIYRKVWDEFNYSFPNQMVEWISNFLPHFTGHIITYPCLNWSQSMLVEGDPSALWADKVPIWMYKIPVLINVVGKAGTLKVTNYMNYTFFLRKSLHQAIHMLIEKSTYFSVVRIFANAFSPRPLECVSGYVITSIVKVGMKLLIHS